MISTLLVPHVVYNNGVFGDHEHQFICSTGHNSLCRSRLKPDHLPRFLYVYVCMANQHIVARMRSAVSMWRPGQEFLAAGMRSPLLEQT